MNFNLTFHISTRKCKWRIPANGVGLGLMYSISVYRHSRRTEKAEGDGVDVLAVWMCLQFGTAASRLKFVSARPVSLAGLKRSCWTRHTPRDRNRRRFNDGPVCASSTTSTGITILRISATSSTSNNNEFDFSWTTNVHRSYIK